MQGKDKKTFYLEEMGTLIGRIKKTRRNKDLLARLTAMRTRIEKSGPIEIQTQQFNNSIIEELGTLIQNEGAKRERNYCRLENVIKLGFFLSILCNFCISTFTNFQSKQLPSRPIAIIVWLMIGMLGSTLTLPIYALYSSSIDKIIKLQLDVPALTSSYKKELIIKFAVIIFNCLNCAITMTFLYIFSVSFYLRVFPLLVTLVTQAFQLDISSLFGTIFIIIGNIGALLTLYEFLEKRLQKRHSKSSS